MVWHRAPVSSGIHGRLKGARGRPAGMNVSEIKGVELSPEDVTLCAECGVREILLFASARMAEAICEGKLSVFGCLR